MGHGLSPIFLLPNSLLPSHKGSTAVSDYDFKTLNDKEFEILAADLLSARDSVHYERFKPGRDLGVDGRYFAADGQEVVLQSKHWATSPLERLVKHLEEVELPKVNRLLPKKYLLAISHPLSRTDKTRISTIFHPYVLSPSDILGQEDLNDLLASHPEVERRHYKLWISSTTALSYFLNKAIYDRSLFAAEEILGDAHLYVPTQNHDLAIQKLEKLGCVIITGPAGIGKTTLADHLCLHYLKQDYRLIRVAEEIREAEAVFDSETDQIFYFDDFLGRNYLEALSGHEGAHIVQFIRRISKDRRKRFVLTSRTTILNQGKLLLDVFQNNNLDRNEFEVTLESFSEMDRARVLYNHLWHSNLEPDYIDVIYENKRYRDVIRHRNYNPRLIRFITDSDRLTNISAENYWQHIKSLLENPTTVWQNPFESQTDDFGRALVLLVALNGRAISQTDLSESFARYVSHPNALLQHGKRDFLVNLKHLTGSLLTRTIIAGSEAGIDLFNPSIGDFVLHRYATDIPALRIGFACLRSTTSLKTLADLSRNGLLTTSVAEAIYRHLLQNAADQNFVGYSAEYVAVACLRLHEPLVTFDASDPLLVSAVTFVVRSECPSYFLNVAEFLNRAFDAEMLSKEQSAQFVRDACKRRPMAEELEQLAALQERLSEDLRNDILPDIEAATLTYLIDAVHDEFSDDDVFDSVSPEDISDAYTNLQTLIDEKLNTYKVDLTASAVDQIVEAFDIESRAESYFKPDDDDDDGRYSSAAAFHLDEIDDLFDRSK